MKLADNLQHEADTFNRQTIIKTHKYDGVENTCNLLPLAKRPFFVQIWEGRKIENCKAEKKN